MIFRFTGEFTLPAGKITQLRFYLDAKETGASTPSNPGCYGVLTNDSEQDLFVPSGGSSGYKAAGSFDVPLNGVATLTADFDVRKSLKLTGSTYNLQPTIRLIADDEAGKITGTVTYSGDYELVIFAYENGEYAGSEASAGKADGSYILPFLAAGTYDLIFAEVDTDGNYVAASASELSDVIVSAGETTSQDFTY